MVLGKPRFDLRSPLYARSKRSRCITLLQAAMESKLVCDHALPAPGQSAVWRFKAIFRDGNVQFGKFSDVVSVLVAGS